MDKGVDDDELDDNTDEHVDVFIPPDDSGGVCPEDTPTPTADDDDVGGGSVEDADDDGTREDNLGERSR